MDTLKAEILQLERELNAKKKTLFVSRFKSIIGKLESISNITSINIHTDVDSDTWTISYIHKTSDFKAIDYLYEKVDINETDSDESDDNIKTNKTTKIIFGVNITSSDVKKYFIKGIAPLDVYKTSTNEFRIINLEYQFDIDYDEQKELITTYADNINLPEYAAIKFMLYISDNEWDDTAIINHFTMI